MKFSLASHFQLCLAQFWLYCLPQSAFKTISIPACLFYVSTPAAHSCLPVHVCPFMHAGVADARLFSEDAIETFSNSVASYVQVITRYVNAAETILSALHTCKTCSYPAVRLWALHGFSGVRNVSTSTLNVRITLISMHHGKPIYNIK